MRKIIGSKVLLILFVFGFTIHDRMEATHLSYQVLIESEENQVYLVHDEDGEKVDVFVGDKLFTSYIYSDKFKPFLYPVYSANGNPVTRGYPINPRPGESTDHPHQVGLWLNYGDVNGIDFWNNSERVPDDRRDRFGTIVHTEIVSMESSGNKAVLEVVKHWLNAEGDVLLVEHTGYSFQNSQESGSGDIRMIDRITRLTAYETDISFTDNKEGMLGLRLARELEHYDRHDDASGLYVSSEGLTGHDVWGTRSKWMNLDGKIGDEKVSVTIFDHPENVGYPTYWHARGYGLYAANPLGKYEMSEGAEELNYQLSSGDSLTFRHRVVISSGAHTAIEDVERLWQNWAQN